MRTTIDKAGRLVVPKELRDRIGLRPGEVDVVVDGAALRIEVVTQEHLVREEGRLVVAGTGEPLTDDVVEELRAADRR
jgi:AbrB family looped-hinge helix DNA binding protein